MSYERIFELANDHNIPYEYSNKLYYRKYKFRLKFKVFELVRAGAWGYHYRHNQKYHDLDYNKFNQAVAEQRALSTEQYKSIRRALFRRSKGEGYSLRASGWHGLNVYTVNEHDVRLLINNYGTEVRQLYAPKNEAHETLHGESTKELRQNLFYKKYRYKLEYNGTTKFKDSISSAVGCMIDDGSVKYSLNTRACLKDDSQFVRSWNICSIYFEHEEDFLTFKMMCNEKPAKSIEAVLFSEVDK
jgi:hypothetical protein